MDITSGNSSVLDKKQRHLLEKELTEYLLTAAEQGKIQLGEIQPIAQEIVVDFDKLKNFDDTIALLEKISKKWAWYANLLTKFKGAVQKDKEKEIINKLSHYIKNTH